jgi:carnitine O-acetyltransferase
MLDVGCSYGLGSAFVKYGCSFDEMVAFFSSRAPTQYHAACETMRMWLNIAPPACDVRCVGLDSSEPAIRFAVDAGLLDGGIARNFENDEVTPTEGELAWFRSCNLMISTGAIGYVTEKTLDVILIHIGKDNPGEFGPFSVVTILRMFDPSPIGDVFEKYGYKFGAVPGVRLPQRTFVDQEERHKVISLLKEREIDTSGLEDRGKLYAGLFIASPPDQFPALQKWMITTHSACVRESEKIGYIRR